MVLQDDTHALARRVELEHVVHSRALDVAVDCEQRALVLDAEIGEAVALAGLEESYRTCGTRSNHTSRVWYEEVNYSYSYCTLRIRAEQQAMYECSAHESAVLYEYCTVTYTYCTLVVLLYCTARTYCRYIVTQLALNNNEYCTFVCTVQ